MCYLKTRDLLQQYKKAKYLIANDLLHLVHFKKREPRSKDIWSFRITRKYRALCKRKGDVLIVFDIDDHQ